MSLYWVLVVGKLGLTDTGIAVDCWLVVGVGWCRDIALSVLTVDSICTDLPAAAGPQNRLLQ